MASLPVDIFTIIIEHASLGVVNALARSCSTLETSVRMNANRLAAARVRITKYPDCSVPMLPNGVVHGLTTIYAAQSHMSIWFERDMALHWCLDDNRTRIIWGHDSVPYTLRTQVAEIASIVCRVYINIRDVQIVLDTRGTAERLRPGAVRRTWHTRPLRGYLVDGRMDVDTVDPWVRSCLATAGIEMPSLNDVGTRHELGHMPSRAHKVLDRVRSVSYTRS